MPELGEGEEKVPVQEQAHEPRCHDHRFVDGKILTDKKENKHKTDCPEPQLWEGQIWHPAHLRRIQEHPCYSPKAAHAFGRIHLPVAPRCNIQCNYCIRDFDCVHESRPGVTSRIISPREALERVSECVARFPNIKVVGIAGPGEPIYNEETFETFRLIKKNFPYLLHCVSSNGLLLFEKLDKLKDVGVTNITVTLNAIKPEISEKIYSFIYYGGKVYSGWEGANILLQNQLRGIEAAVKKEMTVKINTVLIPGINDRHIVDIAQKARDLGVFVHNIMPLIPQYLFSNITPPSPDERKRVQDQCAKIIPQMRHCRQCRADAVGKLGEDITSSLSYKDADLQEVNTNKVRVAVATTGSGVVDLHFGHTSVFFIYEVDPTTLSVQSLGKRKVEEAYCKGPECDLPSGQEDLIKHIIDLLKDCKFVLCRRIGILPATRLKKTGIIPIEDVGTIENAIRKGLSKKD